MTTGGNKKAPPTVGAARGAGRPHSQTGKPANRITKRANRKPSLTFGAADGNRITVRGRQAQTLALLVSAACGASPPARRRLSAGDGAKIGRYILACPPPIYGEGV